jgi:hypothetical protein
VLYNCCIRGISRQAAAGRTLKGKVDWRASSLSDDIYRWQEKTAAEWLTAGTSSSLFYCCCCSCYSGSPALQIDAGEDAGMPATSSRQKGVLYMHQSKRGRGTSGRSANGTCARAIQCAQQPRPVDTSNESSHSISLCKLVAPRPLTTDRPTAATDC